MEILVRPEKTLTSRNGVSYECNVEEVALDWYKKNRGFKEGWSKRTKLFANARNNFSKCRY